jgi:hypothetical protein
VVRPEQVTYVTIPEKVAVVRRNVVTSPARVEREHVPAVYETKVREVEVAPASVAWRPLAPGY